MRVGRRVAGWYPQSCLLQSYQEAHTLLGGSVAKHCILAMSLWGSCAKSFLQETMNRQRE